MARNVAGVIFLPELRRFSATQSVQRRRSALFVTPATLYPWTCDAIADCKEGHKKSQALNLAIQVHMLHYSKRTE